MFRYFLYMCYKGTKYCGWQKQPNAPTVQAAVEEALGKLLHSPTELTGTGRTDTGVHARYYVAHFDTQHPIAESKDFIRRLNAILPYDIAVFDLRRVTPEAHARFSAISRTYQYHLVQRKNPFSADFAWHIHYTLEIERMNEAATYLTTVKDFTAFAKLHSNNTTNFCQVFQAEWEQHNEECIFTITANRFLRNMVRAIVGNLVDVGRGKLSINEFKNRVSLADRSMASVSAPAKGLFFTHVEYPDTIFLDNKLYNAVISD
ncbi:MAG: tRNA pseudouridine(38-40) synthase TruA [Bacteroidales bacterium]